LGSKGGCLSGKEGAAAAAGGAMASDLPTSVKFATAGLGGIGGWIIVHPFNTFAVRMNLASSQPGYVPMSFARFSMKTVAEKGIWSAYDGLAAGCTRQIFYATSRFGLFEVFRDKIHEARGTLGAAERVLAGLSSGACAAFIACPAEVSLVRMSNDSSLPKEQRRNYKGVVDAFARIAKEDGVAAFWRGCAPFVQRAMLVGIVQVGTLDQNKHLLEQHAGMKRGTYPNIFAASFASGLMYSIVTLPFETAKNRMAFQKPDANGVLPYRSTVQTITAVAKESGAMALWNGFTPYYCRCGGHTVSMFVIVEMLRGFYAPGHTS
jgi:solute carrier family 25 oxoglutarate transporter 11